MNKVKILSDLEEILNLNIDPLMFPYVKGNSIRIGKYIVRSSKNGFYKIFDCEEHKMMYQTFCKSSAIALAKNLAKNKSNAQKILSIDKDIQKWYNDCVFYKYTIDVTKDDFKRDITITRYDIAKAHTAQARKKLERFIFE